MASANASSTSPICHSLPRRRLGPLAPPRDSIPVMSAGKWPTPFTSFIAKHAGDGVQSGAGRSGPCIQRISGPRRDEWPLHGGDIGTMEAFHIIGLYCDTHIMT